MKKCNYCGKDYPDSASVCAIDGEPLVLKGPKPTAGAGDNALHNQQLEALLANPPFYADPVFPKENYLQVLGAGLFRQILAQMNARQLVEHVRVMNTNPQMAMLFAQPLGFWVIDLEVASKQGFSGRDEFLSRVRETVRRPPSGMAAYAMEQHLLAKGVVKIQIEDQPPVPGEYQICKLRTIGWYVARLVPPPR